MAADGTLHAGTGGKPGFLQVEAGLTFWALNNHN